VAHGPGAGEIPELGRLREHGRWSGYGFILGPWRWMLVLYKVAEDGDT